MRIPRKLWDFIDSDNETPLWWGQPNAIPEVQRMLAPLSIFLYALAILCFGWAFWKIISALLIFSASQMDAETKRWVLYQSLAFFATGGILLWLRWYFLNNYQADVQNNTYYLVTTQRAQIIQYDPKDPDESQREIVGRGEIRLPSLQPIDNSRFNLYFFEAPDSLGKVTYSEKDQKPRRPIVWRGFTNLTRQDAEDALKALTQLLETAEKIVNALFRVSFTVPEGWTMHTYNVPSVNRDETVLNLLIADAVDTHSLLKKPKVTPEWNTAVFYKRLDSKWGAEKGFIPGATIVVEFCSRDGEFTEVVPMKAGDILRGAQEVFNRFLLYEGIIYNSYACQFRRGYRITRRLLAELQKMEDKKGNPLIPDYVIENLTHFADWETNDEKIFDEVLQKAVPGRVGIKFKRDLVHLIKQKSAFRYPLVDNKGGTALYLNNKLKPLELHGSMQKSGFVDSSIEVAEKKYRLRQYFGYVPRGKKTVTFCRFTYFCSEADKSDLFEKHTGLLKEFVGSIHFHD